MRCPVVDLSTCILCEVCVAACPSVFSITDTGWVAVAELDRYPEEEVNEAINNCPKDCITWEPC
jgi:ferredoxin